MMSDLVNGLNPEYIVHTPKIYSGVVLEIATWFFKEKYVTLFIVLFVFLEWSWEQKNFITKKKGKDVDV